MEKVKSEFEYLRNRVKELEEQNDRLRFQGAHKFEERERRNMEMVEGILKQERQLKIEIHELKIENERLQGELQYAERTKELNSVLEERLARLVESKREDEGKLEKAYRLIDSLKEDFKEYKLISEQENRNYSEKSEELEKDLAFLQKIVGIIRDKTFFIILRTEEKDQKLRELAKSERKARRKLLEAQYESGAAQKQSESRATSFQNYRNEPFYSQTALDGIGFGVERTIPRPKITDEFGQKDEEVRKRRELILAKRQELEKYNELLDELASSKDGGEKQSSLRKLQVTTAQSGFMD